MIKFFRKIRYDLMGENKTGKYLKYAIGEILLVVIGIIIALQINNWNNIQQEKKFERKILSEIKSSLKADLEFHEFMKERLDIKKQNIQQLLQMRKSTEIHQDSTILKVYNQSNLGFLLAYNVGAYETIKSIGLDKISNDTIRTLLTKYYEVVFPRIFEAFTIKSKKDPEISGERTRLHNILWQRLQIQLPDKSWKIVTIPKVKNILLSPELLDRIKIEQDYSHILNKWFNSYESDLKYIIDKLENELSKTRV